MTSELLGHTQPPWLGFCLLCHPLFLHSPPPKHPSKPPASASSAIPDGPTSEPGLTVPSAWDPSHPPHLTDSSHALVLSSRDIFSGKPPPKLRGLLPRTEYTQHVPLKIFLCCIFFCCWIGSPLRTETVTYSCWSSQCLAHGSDNNGDI